MSETAKYRYLTTKYCHGNGVDIGSGGEPVVPWAMQVELGEEDYAQYNSGHTPATPIVWRGSALDLPLRDGVADFVYCSHLLEDFADWNPPLREWTRVLKVGGRLVILIPDKARWNEALRRGQPPNCAHRHEGFVGELTGYIDRIGGFRVLEDRLTNLTPEDYSILFVARKEKG